MAELPKIVRQRLEGQSANASHVDPNLLAAFSEGALNKAERESVLGHLTTCAHCREVAALAAAETDASTGTFSIAAAAEQRRFTRIFAWRWSVVAVTACLVVGSAVMLRMRTPTQSAEQRQVVQVQPQATPAEPGSSVGKLKGNAADVGKDRDALGAPKRQPPMTKAEAHGRRLQAPMTINGITTVSPPALIAEAPAAEAKGGLGPIAKKQASAQAEKGWLKADVGADRGAASSNVQAAPAPPATADGRADKLAKNSEAMDVAANAAPAPQGKVRAGVSGGVAPASSASARVAQTAPGEGVYVFQAKAQPVRWTIAADGSLRRSSDNGQSWQAVSLEVGKPFRAVTSGGAVVWAGGSSSALFRSVDAGEHWARIQPVVGQQSLTGAVTSIHLEGSSNQIVRVQTSTGQKWISNDGGGRWRVE